MAPTRNFTPDQVARYARHLILPEVGGAGQRKLLNSSVLLLGAGGLGSPAAMYLAAAGVGKIGIVDFDVVDASNLQRQLLHGHDIIGSMMAFETIKYLLDIGRPMIGRYLLFEGEDMSFRELRLRQNKACPLCGENPTVDSLIDYEAWCGAPAMEPSEARAS